MTKIEDNKEKKTVNRFIAKKMCAKKKKVEIYQILKINYWFSVIAPYNSRSCVRNEVFATASTVAPRRSLVSPSLIMACSNCGSIFCAVFTDDETNESGVISFWCCCEEMIILLSLSYSCFCFSHSNRESLISRSREASSVSLETASSGERKYNGYKHNDYSNHKPYDLCRSTMCFDNSDWKSLRYVFLAIFST